MRNSKNLSPFDFERADAQPFEGTANLSATEIREARRFAVQYVYQLDVNQQLFFQQSGFEAFCKQGNIPPTQQTFVRALTQGVLETLSDLDNLITKHSRNWKLNRIAKVDLAILRVCSFELNRRKELAVEMIIADAAEIGKEYGAANSSAFVNGVLDGIAKELRA